MPILPTPEILQRVIIQRAERKDPQVQASRDMRDDAQLPEWVLFGASMTEWSFDESTQGLGWFLQRTYDSKVRVVNEGQAGYTSTTLRDDFDRIITRATSPSAPPTLLFTIFLGANDACFMGEHEYVPWPRFESNYRNFIETILTQDAMQQTKIVLITPPPNNMTEPKRKAPMSDQEIEDENAKMQNWRGYKTYMSKKRYAEGVIRIAAEYEETGRVIGLDFWRALVNAKWAEDGDAAGELEEKGLWPGCGLLGAGTFGKGWFTDGLHLDRKGYAVLSKLVMEKVVGKWPELGPEGL